MVTARQSLTTSTRQFLCLIAVGALSVAMAPARAETSPEYKLKAAFLFNFAKFVKWPSQVFGDRASPVVIGVLGEDPFGSVLDEIVQSRTINGRPVTIKRSEQIEDLTSCQVLFISASEKEREAEILTALAGKPVLTVSDTEEFLGRGGMIQMKLEQQKIRFEICKLAAERAQVSISAQLLSLAVAVHADRCGRDG